MVFDLDPGEPADVLDCARLALELRALFENLGLDCLVKTSGSKGLQLYVPLNSDVDFASTKTFATGSVSQISRAAERSRSSSSRAGSERGLTRSILSA